VFQFSFSSCYHFFTSAGEGKGRGGGGVLFFLVFLPANEKKMEEKGWGGAGA